MTNYEKIKQMSVEEMAEWLKDALKECDVCVYGKQNICPETCVYGVKQWLEREVEENE